MVTKAVEEAEFLQDALNRAQDVVELYSQSGKFKSIYSSTIGCGEDEPVTPGSLRPICPTRWLPRAASIKSVLDNYQHILVSLREASKTLGFGNSVSKRASNVHANLAHWKCILGLLAAKPIIERLELLNKTLQGRSMNFSAMKQNVAMVRGELCDLRNEECFSAIYNQTVEMCENLGLGPPSLPRQQKVPKRFESGESAHHFSSSAMDLYRRQFSAAIDVAVSNLDNRFDSEDFRQLDSITDSLITGSVDEAILNKYPQLDMYQLDMQLQMYVHNYKRTTIAEHIQVFREMSPDVMRMFPQVKMLLKLALVSPTSSCEAERSFSALRRTWLRANTTQERLNSVAVCHVHRQTPLVIRGGRVMCFVMIRLIFNSLQSFNPTSKS